MNRIQQFLALAFGLSWLSLPLFFWLGGHWNSPAAIVFSMGYMWMPGLCALGMQLRSGQSLTALGLCWSPNRWWLLAWLGPPAAALASLGTGLLMPGVRLSWSMDSLFARLGQNLPAEQLDQAREALVQSPVHPIFLMLIQGLIAGATINALAALGEELGWRGLLHAEFGHLNFWKASGLTGLIWGLWHAPLILQGHNYPEHPLPGVILMILWCLLLAPLFTWMRLKGASVLATALMHGSLNGCFGLSLILLAGGNDLLIGLTGLAGMIVLGLLNLLLLILAPELRQASLDELA